MANANNFTKILPTDTNGKGVVGLPDAPGLASGDMQKKFDELATDVIIPKFNQLSEELDNMQIGTELTYNEWNALTEAEKRNGDYYITDYPDEFAKAVNIPIDAISGLDANNVQNALNQIKTLLANFSLSPKLNGVNLDVNTLKSGIAYLNSSSPNLPITQWGWVFTLNDGGTLVDDIANAGFQIYYSAQSNDSFIRYYFNGTWSTWKRLVTDNEMYSAYSRNINKIKLGSHAVGSIIVERNNSGIAKCDFYYGGIITDSTGIFTFNSSDKSITIISGWNMTVITGTGFTVE